MAAPVCGGSGLGICSAAASRRARRKRLWTSVVQASRFDRGSLLLFRTPPALLAPAGGPRTTLSLDLLVPRSEYDAAATETIEVVAHTVNHVGADNCSSYDDVGVTPSPSRRYLPETLRLSESLRTPDTPAMGPHVSVESMKPSSDFLTGLEGIHDSEDEEFAEDLDPAAEDEYWPCALPGEAPALSFIAIDDLFKEIRCAFHSESPRVILSMGVDASREKFLGLVLAHVEGAVGLEDRARAHVERLVDEAISFWAGDPG